MTDSLGVVLEEKPDKFEVEFGGHVAKSYRTFTVMEDAQKFSKGKGIKHPVIFAYKNGKIIGVFDKNWQQYGN